MGSLLCLLAMAAAAVLLLRSIRDFRAAWSAAEIARGPAVAVQTLRLSEAGPLALFLDGPRYGTYTKRLQFSLRNAETRQPVSLQPVLMGAGVRSPRRSRVQRGRFVLPRAGAFELQIEGLQPEDAREYAIVIMRPFTGRLVRFILSCVLLGMALVGSLVAGILLLVL